MISMLYAENVASAPNSLSFSNFLPMFLIIIVFYFFIIRPQSKRAKDHKIMLSNLKKGDRVLISSGIYGYIDSFRSDDENVVSVTIADNTNILVLKDSIIKVDKK